jgi:hypothetical protein
MELRRYIEQSQLERRTLEITEVVRVACAPLGARTMDSGGEGAIIVMESDASGV